MPITLLSSEFYGGVAAEWIFNPDEIVDFSEFTDIICLEISASPSPLGENQEQEAYKLPSIAARFPNLRYLTIRSLPGVPCFIGAITDVPNTVLEVLLENTYIADLSPILRFGKNMVSFWVQGSVQPIAMSIPLPSNLNWFVLESTIVTDPIIFPDTIISVACSGSTIPRIYGLERAHPDLYCSIQSCITPYNPTRLDNWDINYMVEYITGVNAELAYLDFGSIPKRIPVSPDNIENPIVVAMNLSSNYPRRMAEFIAITEVTTEFTPPPEIDGWPHEMWD